MADNKKTPANKMIRRDLTRIVLSLEDLEELDPIRLMRKYYSKPKEKAANSDDSASTSTGASTSSAHRASSTIGLRLSADLGTNPRTIAETQATISSNPSDSATSTTSEASSSGTQNSQEDFQERLLSTGSSVSTDDTVDSTAASEGSHTFDRADDRTREGFLDDDDGDELEGAVGGLKI